MPLQAHSKGRRAMIGAKMDQDSPAPVPKLLGAVEAAKRLNISRKTLFRYSSFGIVPVAQKLPSGMYRYDPEAIEAIRLEWVADPSSRKAALATG